MSRRQVVQRDHSVTTSAELTYDVAADVTGAAGDENVWLHGSPS